MEIKQWHVLLFSWCTICWIWASTLLFGIPDQWLLFLIVCFGIPASVTGLGALVGISDYGSNSVFLTLDSGKKEKDSGQLSIVEKAS